MGLRERGAGQNFKKEDEGGLIRTRGGQSSNSSKEEEKEESTRGRVTLRQVKQVSGPGRRQKQKAEGHEGGRGGTATKKGEGRG